MIWTDVTSRPTGCNFKAFQLGDYVAGVSRSEGHFDWSLHRKGPEGELQQLPTSWHQAGVEFDERRQSKGLGWAEHEINRFRAKG